MSIIEVPRNLWVFFSPFEGPLWGTATETSSRRRFVCQSASPPKASQGPWTLSPQQAGSGDDREPKKETPRGIVNSLGSEIMAVQCCHVWNLSKSPGWRNPDLWPPRPWRTSCCRWRCKRSFNTEPLPLPLIPTMPKLGWNALANACGESPGPPACKQCGRWPSFSPSMTIVTGWHQKGFGMVDMFHPTLEILGWPPTDKQKMGLLNPIQVNVGSCAAPVNASSAFPCRPRSSRARSCWKVSGEWSYLRSWMPFQRRAARERGGKERAKERGREKDGAKGRAKEKAARGRKSQKRRARQLWKGGGRFRLRGRRQSRWERGKGRQRGASLTYWEDCCGIQLAALWTLRIFMPNGITGNGWMNQARK